MESEILQCSPQTMSTLRLRRNIFKNRKYDDCGSANQSFVTIKLYGRLAATWASERMDLKDTEFIKRLLVIKKKYDNLLHTCKCKDGFQIAAKEFEHNEWFREENIANPDLNIESDDEERTIMNIEIDKCDPEIQASKDTGSCFDSSDSDYELNEDKDIDKFQPFCKLCNKAVKKGQKVKHSMSEHFILYVECKKCKEIDANDDDSTKDSDKDLIPLNEYFDHLITTHESVKCVFCKSNCMLKKDKLRDHFMKKHAKYILCRCLECDKGNGNTNSAVVKESLVKAHSVKGHLLSIHTPEGQGRFPCSICGLLMTAKSIARHMKNIHANKALDESNLCDICGKYFTYLKRHKKIHIPLTERLKNKNHQCTTCGKSFSNKYNLRVHSRLHTGEKPYVCDVCGKGFCQNVELRLHTHNHHNKIKTRSKKTRKKREPESETIESSLNGIVLQKVQLVESKVVAPISNETNQQTLTPHVLEIHPRDNDLSQVHPIYAVLTAEGLPTTHNDAILSGNENFLQNLDSIGASVANVTY